ncbi:MAG TPA: DUF4159 domain-containing protein [Bryobacterales bacterium]|nr:DUF4159 domain-containing protein [Bryobacterales bacterium]
MRRGSVLFAILAVCSLLTVVFAQRGFREYPYEEVNPAPVPPDANEKTEWAFARLRYPSGRYVRWRRGSWPTDFPKADRQFVQGVRRLTLIHTRSAEQVIDLDLDDGEIFYWPWVYAVEVGHWDLTDQQCRLLREYLLRGGFLMVDDYHGEREWGVFTASMNRVFPDRPIVEIPNDDPIFHVLYDLSERIQVPGTAALRRGVTYEYGGIVPHWRSIRDDKGRVMVAMCFNQDNGDAWEWADSPDYPERATSQAYRLGINYILYAMTH